MKNRGFVIAIELKIGDELIDSEQNTLIVEDTRLETCVTPVTVYNFEVEDFHTYHIGYCCILVHNANDYASPSSKFTSELDVDKIRTTTNAGTVPSGGRSGGSRQLDNGTPNSYVTADAGHRLVYGADGRLNLDITPNRVKVCVWDQAPDGNLHARDLKLKGSVPPELLINW